MAVLIEIMFSFWAMLAGWFTTGKGPKYIFSLGSRNSYRAFEPKAKPTTDRWGMNLGWLLLMTPSCIRTMRASDIISVWQPRSFFVRRP